MMQGAADCRPCIFHFQLRFVPCRITRRYTISHFIAYYATRLDVWNDVA